MSNIPTEEIKDELLYCAICLENYNDPRLLNCHHTFCTPCLQQTAGSATTISCPTCRKLTTLGRRGVYGLPFDRTVMRLMELINVYEQSAGPDQIKICSKCETAAVAQCTECVEYLCELHCQLHPLSHSVLVSSEVLATCSLHRELALDIYCAGCDYLCCQSCADEEHKCHELSSLEMIHGLYRNELMAYSSRTKTALDLVNSRRASLEKTLYTMSNKKAEVQQDIALHFDHQQGIVQKCGDSLVGRVETNYRRSAAVLTKKKESLDDYRGKLGSLCDQLQRSKELNYGNLVRQRSALISQADQLFKSLDGMADVDREAESSSCTMVFIAGQSLSHEAVGQLGKLAVVSPANSSLQVGQSSAGHVKKLSAKLRPIGVLSESSDVEYLTCDLNQVVSFEVIVKDENGEEISGQNLPATAFQASLSYAALDSNREEPYPGLLTISRGGEHCDQSRLTASFKPPYPGVYRLSSSLFNSSLASKQIALVVNAAEPPSNQKSKRLLSAVGVRCKSAAAAVSQVVPLTRERIQTGFQRVQPHITRGRVRCVLVVMMAILLATAALPKLFDTGDSVKESPKKSLFAIREDMSRFYGLSLDDENTCAQMAFAGKFPSVINTYGKCWRNDIDIDVEPTKKTDDSLVATANSTNTWLERMAAYFLSANEKRLEAARTGEASADDLHLTTHPLGKLVNFVLENVPFLGQASNHTNGSDG